MTSQWQPDEHLINLLDLAAKRGDVDAYLTALLDSCLVMPVEPEIQRWPTVVTDDGTMLVVFTSIDRLQASPVGVQATPVVWPILDLVHHWPHPQWSLLVDPTLDSQILLGPEVISTLAPRAAVENPLDAALRAAGDDQAAYLQALLTGEVVVPASPDGSPSRDLSDPEFAWWRATVGTSDPADTSDPFATSDTSATAAPAIAIFSSPVRLRARLGDVPWLIAPFLEVLEHWPAGHAALVDPDHHNGQLISAPLLDWVAAHLGQAQQAAEAAAAQVFSGDETIEPTEELVAAARTAALRAVEEYFAGIIRDH